MWKLLLILPFLFILLGIPFANRIHPFLLGIPFGLFWVSFGILFSFLVIWILYHLDPKNKEEDDL
ncbi:DUF3311 domain-containing protein [Listeria sp. PSOL-1]|uniref:DUF3311 domain-containing protein n=1 Tax=Listeria sp. PSOL-1 TaxID=1844999 RepID=UPI0013D798AD|nr:DUF3311 domain-containing protein [Listeria sp. PSOL-1]